MHAWPLLKNRDSLRPGEGVQLEELLTTNRSLFIVCALRDALKDLWGYRATPGMPPEPGAGGTARRSQWHRSLAVFARRLRPCLPGILAHCRWPLGTYLVERINNKIKVIQRMAYMLARRCLLPPQDPGRVPRSWKTNQKKWALPRAHR